MVARTDHHYLIWQRWLCHKKMHFCLPSLSCSLLLRGATLPMLTPGLGWRCPILILITVFFKAYLLYNSLRGVKFCSVNQDALGTCTLVLHDWGLPKTSACASRICLVCPGLWVREGIEDAAMNIPMAIPEGREYPLNALS